VAHPSTKIIVCVERRDVDAEPAIHLAPAHLKAAHLRLAAQDIGLCRVNPQQEATLAARTDRHIAADQERQPTEHALLGEAGLALKHLAESIRELFVICHGRSMTGTIDDGLLGILHPWMLS
jgi:hypothetical protein